MDVSRCSILAHSPLWGSQAYPTGSEDFASLNRNIFV
jgi:hypothetical protein